MPAPATPNLRYTSGNFSEAVAVTLPVFDAPFKADGNNEDCILTQDFIQNLSSFARIDLSSPHPDYPEFLLVEESELRDATGGKVRWTRTYAKVPTDFTVDRGTIAFTFPGKSGLVTGGIVGYGGSATGRRPLDKTVTVRIARAFFLNPQEATEEEPADIPVLEQFQVTYGAELQPTAYLNNNADNPLYDDTVPSRTEYEALVTAGDRIVAQDSSRDIWMGQIYMRETFYVIAQ